MYVHKSIYIKYICKQTHMYILIYYTHKHTLTYLHV